MGGAFGLGSPRAEAYAVTPIRPDGAPTTPIRSKAERSILAHRRPAAVNLSGQQRVGRGGEGHGHAHGSGTEPGLGLLEGGGVCGEIPSNPSHTLGTHPAAPPGLSALTVLRAGNGCRGRHRMGCRPHPPPVGAGVISFLIQRLGFGLLILSRNSILSHSVHTMTLLILGSLRRASSLPRVAPPQRSRSSSH